MHIQLQFVVSRHYLNSFKVMKILSVISLLLILLTVTNNAFADIKAVIEFSKASTQTERDIKEWLEKSDEMSYVIELINKEFVLPKQLTFSFGGKDEPVYDAETNTVLIPYFFISDVEEYFEDAQYSRDGINVQQATMDALLHTIFHELGHALINMFDLPVLGREEDAADGLASVFLIEYFDQGQSMLRSAADLFKLEGKARGEIEIEDFKGEHSIDEQRYYAALCHIYGSDEKSNKRVKKEAGFSEDRAELCVEDYESLSRGWFSVLKPHMASQ